MSSAPLLTTCIPSYAHFESLIHYSPVSALSFSADGKFLFAGLISQLHIYRVANGSLIRKVHVFEAGKIHAIRQYPDFPHRLFLIGQKRVACYCITQIGDSIDLVLQNDFTAQDWIWDVFPVNPQLRASYPAFFNGLSDIKELWVLGTAHNVVEVWDPVEKLRYVQIRGESQSVLHSLRFHFRSDNNRFYVASGTVFNQVLVWEPLLSTKLKKCLIGHEGVVWGVLWDARGNHIASWSDDRSARVWDITDIDQGSVDVSCSKELWGHSARIWNAVFAMDDRYIVTACEDGLLIVWEWSTTTQILSIDGNLGGVWSSAYSPINHTLASGSINSSIKLWNLKNKIQSRLREDNLTELESVDEGDFVRVLMLCGPSKSSSTNTFVIATNKGHVSRGGFDGSKTQLATISAKGSIQCGCLSASQDIVLLSDNSGTIFACGLEGNDSWRYQWAAAKSRVQAMWICEPNEVVALFGESSFSGMLVCLAATVTAELQLWVIDKKTKSEPQATLVAQFEPQVPVTSENSSTMSGLEGSKKSQKKTKKAAAANSRPPAIWSYAIDEKKRLLWAGDATGGISVFRLPEQNILADRMKTLTLFPSITLSKVHDSERVTTITIGTNSQVVYSGGRNGRICNLRYSKYSNSELEVAEISSSKLHHSMDLIERLLVVPNSLSSSFDEESDLYAYGIFGQSVLVVNASQQQTVFSINCSGPKRPLDILISEKNIYKGPDAFAAWKDNRVCVYQSDPAIDSIKHNKLHEAFHWRETNSITEVALPDPRPFRYLVTTSDDNTLHILKQSLDTYEVALHQILKGHGSTTRAVSYVCRDDFTLLFSGGGMLQLRCWKSYRASNGEIYFQLHENPKQAKVASVESDDDGDSRVMALSSISVDERYSVVASARSDGLLDVHVFDDVLLKLHHLWSFSTIGMALTTEILANIKKKTIIIVTGATDGYLRFWNMSERVFSFMAQISNLTGVVDVPALHNAINAETPIFDFRPHQSGINSMHITQCNPSPNDMMNTSDKYFAVTGGDDQTVSTISFQITSLEDGFTAIAGWDHYQLPGNHNACVTGIWTDGDLIVSTSVDHRLNIWKHNEDRSVTNFKLLASTIYEIADVSGLAVTKISLEPRNQVVVATAVGQGLQTKVISAFL